MRKAVILGTNSKCFNSYPFSVLAEHLLLSVSLVCVSDLIFLLALIMGQIFNSGPGGL